MASKDITAKPTKKNPITETQENTSKMLLLSSNDNVLAQSAMAENASSVSSLIKTAVSLNGELGGNNASIGGMLMTGGNQQQVQPPEESLSVALNGNTSTEEDAAAVGKEPSFPVKLHRILSNPEYQEYVTWLPHGRSWRILKPKAFEEKVIPLHFRHAKYASFMRQVNGWGFKRMTQGPDHNSYYHEMFLRGLPHLCDKMRRPSKAKQGSPNLSGRSDYYSMGMFTPALPGQLGASSLISSSNNTPSELLSEFTTSDGERSGGKLDTDGTTSDDKEGNENSSSGARGGLNPLASLATPSTVPVQNPSALLLQQTLRMQLLQQLIPANSNPGTGQPGINLGILPSTTDLQPFNAGMSLPLGGVSNTVFSGATNSVGQMPNPSLAIGQAATEAANQQQNAQLQQHLLNQQRLQLLSANAASGIGSMPILSNPSLNPGTAQLNLLSLQSQVQNQALQNALSQQGNLNSNNNRDVNDSNTNNNAPAG